VGQTKTVNGDEIMPQQRENFTVPRALIDGLASANHQLEKVKWIFDWLADNPSKTEELVDILRQLDEEGLKIFSRALTYRHPQGKTKNPVECAARILKYRLFDQRMENVLRYFKTHRKKEITLANGTACTITHAPWHKWFARFNCSGTQIRCEMYLAQLVTLEDATQNSGALKRIKPLSISYMKSGKWRPLPDHIHRVAMRAIIEKLPFEIAALLTT
jgi:hypothetical protein